ncbi:zinc transporter ZIP3-like [Clavelina lepadiformis]|uniref:zinc transporter ZIP3-like n=1 Tax=Clavelina lepadiformis TaxID=159417 RepID=UPI004042EF94
MEILITKILIIFGLFFSTLLAALIPWLCMRHIRRRRHRREKSVWNRILRCFKRKQDQKEFNDIALENDIIRTTASQANRRKSRSKLILSSLNCFAGGIFLGTSFIGLLPEIREHFIAFNIQWPTFYNSTSTNVTAEVGEEEGENMPIAEIIVCCGLFLILTVEQTAHSINQWRQRRKNPYNGANNLKTSASFIDGRSASIQTNRLETLIKAHHDHAGIRSLMLVATLSIHSLLEGIAIGLQDSVGSILAIFIAVLFHKSLMAFSMGTNLVRAKQTTKKIVSAAFLFSFMSPLGIAIGLTLKTTGGEENMTTALVNAVLQAIATGTFLYITFFEVLVREFESNGNRFAKVFSLLLGYALVLVSFIAQHA